MACSTAGLALNAFGRASPAGIAGEEGASAQATCGGQAGPGLPRRGGGPAPRRGARAGTLAPHPRITRAAARVGPGGAPVLLLDQDRGRWDRLLILRGLSALAQALAPGERGPNALQASMAACHARAPTASETDWPGIVALYDARPEGSLAGGGAVPRRGGAHGPRPGGGDEAGRGCLEEPSLRGHHLLSRVRGELLLRLGRVEEGRSELRRAAALTPSARERKLLSVPAASGLSGGVCPPPAAASPAR